MADIKSLLIIAALLVTDLSISLQDNEAVDNKTVENSENQFRLPKHVVPIHYDIKLIPHIVEGNFTTNGQASIDIVVRKLTNAIAMHVVKLTIDKSLTKITRKDVEDVNSKSDYVPNQHEYNEQTQILTLRFEEPLDPGTYTLHFNFDGEILIMDYKLRGFYRNFYTDINENKVWLALTHFQPTSARQAFPCWDEPAMKATFKFSIKHYPNYTALSNMPSTRSEVDTADGKLWTYFETTPIMSTNLLGFVIADYDYISNLDGTMRIWGPKHLLSHAAYSLDIIEKAMQELEKFTNSTDRMPKMDHVSIPQYSGRATENWGMIVYSQDILLQDKSLYPIRYKIEDAMTITHELAHQWFGNLVTPVWWKYFWLSEGISTYLKYYITDKFYKEWRVMDFMMVDRKQEILQEDSSSQSKPIHSNITSHLDVYNAYSYRTYSKSALLLQMVSHFLREDVFRNGLIKYLQTHEYNNTTPDDLWKALQDTLDESDVPHDNFKVKEVMDTWFEQKGYPLVTINRDHTTGEIKATQEIFIYDNYQYNNIEQQSNNNEAWWIPLNFATRTDPNFSSTLATHWLSPEAEELVIDGINPQDWIIANIQQTGFYRVNYDTLNWLKIADYLDSENYTEVHVLNRAQIINDAIYLMFKDKLDPRIFMDITKYLRRETDYIVWSSLFKMLEDTTKFFAYNGGGELLKSHILDLMNNIVETVGTQDRSNDDDFTKLTRYAILEDACNFDHPTCLHEAYIQLIAYLENPTVLANGTSFHKKRWIFCNGIKQANETIWNKLLYLYTNMSESTLYCLGHSKNLTIIEKFLNMTISEESPIAKSDIYHIINSVLEGGFPNIDVAMDFIVNNWDKFKTIVDDPMDLLHNISWNVISRKHIQKIKALLSKLEMEEPQIIKLREQNIEFKETIVNKIRVWLEHKNLNLPTNFISRLG